jgi:phage baseplate assembly protein W
MAEMNDSTIAVDRAALLAAIRQATRQAVVDGIREYEARRALPSIRRATSARLH